MLQKVHHPHTVQFFGAVTKQTPYMIITEFMGCGSMADMFRCAWRVQQGGEGAVAYVWKRDSSTFWKFGVRTPVYVCSSACK